MEGWHFHEGTLLSSSTHFELMHNCNTAAVSIYVYSFEYEIDLHTMWRHRTGELQFQPNMSALR